MNDQKIRALELANHIRHENMWVKKELRVLVPEHGCHAAVDHLRNDLDGPLASCKVGQFLLAVRQVGPRKVNDMCRRAGVSPTQRLGALTDRQVDALAGELVRQAIRFRRNREWRKNGS